MKIAAWSLLPWEIVQWPVPALLAIGLVLLARWFRRPMRPMPMRAAMHHRRRFE